MKDFFLVMAVKYLKKKGFKFFKTTDGQLSRQVAPPSSPAQGGINAGREGQEYMGASISFPLPEGGKK